MQFKKKCFNIIDLMTTLSQLVYLPDQRVQSDPSSVSDSLISAETIFKEVFFGMRGLPWKLGRMDLSILSLSFRQAMQSTYILVSFHNKGFMYLQFLQKQSCHKLCFYQARLSSLVNKPVELESSVQCKSLFSYIFVRQTVDHL